jgi:hypothetical protein
MIEGVLSSYSIGDYITANCTSGKSIPPANLSWHINGAKVGSAGWAQFNVIVIRTEKRVCKFLIIRT